jgi:hypothetical protein
VGSNDRSRETGNEGDSREIEASKGRAGGRGIVFRFSFPVFRPLRGGDG